MITLQILKQFLSNAGQKSWEAIKTPVGLVVLSSTATGGVTYLLGSTSVTANVGFFRALFTVATGGSLVDRAELKATLEYSQKDRIIFAETMSRSERSLEESEKLLEQVRNRHQMENLKPK